MLVYSLLVTALVLSAPQRIGTKPPESFTANAEVRGTGGTAAAVLVIAVDRYNTDKERAALEQALKTGNDAFLAQLKKMPAVGSLEAGGRKVPVHYAYIRSADEKARSIVVVTTEPVFFVGGGTAAAKPREGYDVAVAQFQVDSVGLGTGSMAAAAKVRAGGPAGVEIEDYGTDPIKFTRVAKNLK